MTILHGLAIAGFSAIAAGAAGFIAATLRSNSLKISNALRQRPNMVGTRYIATASEPFDKGDLITLDLRTGTVRKADQL